MWPTICLTDGLSFSHFNDHIALGGNIVLPLDERKQFLKGERPLQLKLLNQKWIVKALMRVY